MKYYKVKKEYDNKIIYKFARGGGLTVDGFFIGNELLTEAEARQIFNNKHLIGAALLDVCEIVEVPKSEIYWLFGARFSPLTGRATP